VHRQGALKDVDEAVEGDLAGTLGLR
jgi:hypothetical protein